MVSYLYFGFLCNEYILYTGQTMVCKEFQEKLQKFSKIYSLRIVFLLLT